MLVRVFVSLLKELCLGEHGKRIADLLCREGVLDFLCDFKREGAWHQGGEFTDDGIHRGFIISERVGINHAGVLFFGDAGEVCECRLLLLVVRGVPKFHHLLEVREFKARELHRCGDTRESHAAERTFPLAYKLEIRRRGEPGFLRKFTPCKTELLAFIVEVLHVAAVILIFGYRFHGVVSSY